MKKTKNPEVRNVKISGVITFIVGVVYLTSLVEVIDVSEFYKKLLFMLFAILLGFFVAFLLFLPVWSLVKKHVYGPTGETDEIWFEEYDKIMNENKR